MADLTNNLSRQGAIDALNLLIRAKKGPIRSKNYQKDDTVQKDTISSETPTSSKKDDNQAEKKKPRDNQQKDKQLLMPNSEIFDVDDEEDDEDTKNSEGGANSQSSADKKLKVSKIEDNDIDSDENIEKELKDIQIDQIFAQNKKIRQKDAEKAAADAYQKKITPADFSGFKQDLKRAAESQISIPPNPKRSFAKPNAIYADSGLLMPVKMYKRDVAKPVINVYFDKSGSLNDQQIKEGKSAISVLDDFKEKDQLEYTKYWFGNWVVDDESKPCGLRTEAFPKILEHIKQTNATNVIIFTDSDFDKPDQTPNLDNLPYITVQGCVWWIWSNGNKAVKAMKHIRGAKPGTTFQYTI